MPSTDTKAESKAASVEVYGVAARTLHWLTVAMIAVQVPLGIYMVNYGAATNFAAPTAQMYDSHKLIGMALLLLVAVRLVYRLTQGAPGPEPTILPWQRVVSEFTHWLLYVMLLVVPIMGWLAVSYYGPFEPFGIKLPRLGSDNAAGAEFFFFVHKITAFILVALIAMHVGAALMHYFVHKDNVLGRMWPALLRRKD